MSSSADNFISRRVGINFSFNGLELYAEEGMSIAAALLHNSQRITRVTRLHERPRGIFCGIGVCFDCLVIVDGISNQRSCLLEISPGMKIETQRGVGTTSDEDPT